MRQKKELSIKMEITTKSKKRKRHLNKQAKFLLVLSGLLQLGLIQVHINMIINLYTNIIGFFLFTFVLFTLLNILNGSALGSIKTKMNIVSIAIVTAFQGFFAFLYVRVIFIEIATKKAIDFNVGMLLSITVMGASLLLSIISLILVSIYYAKRDDKLIYM